MCSSINHQIKSEVKVKGFIYLRSKVSSLFLLTLFLSPQMAASSHGWGKVTMNGEIVDTACAIDIGSRDQTINMGVLPTSYIREVGKGPIKEFNIKLIDCRWEKYSKDNNEWNSLEVTFDGPSEGDFFTLSGEAKGVQLALHDISGYSITPGKPLPALGITPGTMILKYQMQLVTNYHPVKAGNYQTLLRFKVDYY